MSSTTLRTLYPEQRPDVACHLDVGDGHRLWVEASGPADGLPVVFLHGGPGGGCKAYHRQFFDPARWRVVLIDQRGAGRSQPAGGVEANTTWHLVADLERVREFLGIGRWVLFGGSWGAALALAYAETHPGRVSGMILRGTFLARARDLEWFLAADGVRQLFPDAWAEVVALLGPAAEADLIGHCHRLLFDSADPADAARAARAWQRWGGRVVSLSLDGEPGEEEPAEALVARTRIEVHYARHGYFLEPDQLLRDIGRVPAVPTHLVHGRRDVTCLPEASWRVHRALPGSTLEFVHRAGHLASEPAMTDALVRAGDALAARLGRP